MWLTLPLNDSAWRAVLSLPQRVLKQATVLIVQFFNLAQTVGPVFRVGRIGKIWQAYPTDGISLVIWRIEGLRGIDVKTIIRLTGICELLISLAFS